MKTNYGYKLFEENKDGQLFPLFIDKKKEIPIGEWIHAENVPTKNFAKRPGWHIGMDVPNAPWLKGYDGTDYGCYKSRFSKGKRVWCLVEYNSTYCYDDEVQQLEKKCFEDKIPKDGYYFFREVGKGVWCITSYINIVRKIEEEERQEIMEQKGYDEVFAFATYKLSLEKRMNLTKLNVE